MLLLVQDFLNVSILIQKVIIAKLAARYLLADRLLQHRKAFLKNLTKTKILIESLLVLNHIYHPQYALTLLLSQSPNIKRLLHFGF